MERGTSVHGVLTSFKNGVALGREALQRPLTLADKLILGHLDWRSQGSTAPQKGSYVKLRPVRVAMQDASAQMAMLQFMSAQLDSSRVPASVHCDHLIQAHLGQKDDLERSHQENSEIYDFLESACRKYGIGFWKPGCGIIHQVVLENYAFPGCMMIGTDSHTPNAGGLGTLAIGVGGVDAAEVMAGLPWELQYPRTIGVKLTGQLRDWTSPKDVILHLVGKLTVSGGTGHIIEYFGPGVQSLSCTGMATICNMGAEVGATTSVFPYTDAMSRYLQSTNRRGIDELVQQHAAELQADADAEYDQLIEIDLDKLEPYINGPFTPDRATALSDMRRQAKTEQWPVDITVGLIGSCTNSSYEDMTRAAAIVKEARSHGITFKSKFTVTPGSEQIRATMHRDGLIDIFEDAGALVLANACGPCIGQWRRTDLAKDKPNTILASFNRNFVGRNDGNAETRNFLASPEITTALALAGTLEFDPRRDVLTGPNGPVKLSCPNGLELPKLGFAAGDYGNEEFLNGPDLVDSSAAEVAIPPASDRLQILQPFSPWNGAELENAVVLVKVHGKCTTDHISAAGPWLKYKGHLENLSENTLIGAVNADTKEVNKALNVLSSQWDTIPEVAKQYKAAGLPWVVIADSNYGEGSAREHAAMQPRFLGGAAVVARSLARIHETNLKKQGMLPLLFVDANDYDKLSSTDRISTVGLLDLAPGSTVTLRVTPGPTSSQSGPFEVQLRHTMSKEQIEWFRHGSAMNTAAASTQ